MPTGQSPKFHVDIEGTIYDWDKGTITVPELRELGSLPSDLPVLEIDLKDNTQRELHEDEVVQLRPGLGFSKKVRYQRG
jgi:hypothetical protein